MSKFYENGEGKETVLQQITAKVPAGSIVTLVGPSGSGKSTILSLCNLLITPDRGRVIVEGKEVRDWNVHELRRHVGLAFQMGTMLPGTVKDNLLLAARLHQLETEATERIMQYVGLSEGMLARQADELSGGQKQRVALARTLVNRPSILLLDEVTSALDPAAARGIEELIIKIHNDRQNTILWVTHDLEQAKRVGDFTWLLAEGRLVEQADTASFFSQPKEPFTRRFLKGELSEEATR